MILVETRGVVSRSFSSRKVAVLRAIEGMPSEK
jgi:hypothetical protein